jgi:hypothetical protein
MRQKRSGRPEEKFRRLESFEMKESGTVHRNWKTQKQQI